VSSGAALPGPRPAGPGLRALSRDPRPETSSSRAPTKPMKGIARPAVASREADDPDPAPSPHHRLASHPGRPGGISFDDDDLAEYMHPDDVPAKDPGDADA
jgi:hypothetical protein